MNIKETTIDDKIILYTGVFTDIKILFPKVSLSEHVRLAGRIAARKARR